MFAFLFFMRLHFSVSSACVRAHLALFANRLLIFLFDFSFVFYSLIIREGRCI